MCPAARGHPRYSALVSTLSGVERGARSLPMRGRARRSWSRGSSHLEASVNGPYLAFLLGQIGPVRQVLYCHVGYRSPTILFKKYTENFTYAISISRSSVVHATSATWIPAGIPLDNSVAWTYETATVSQRSRIGCIIPLFFRTSPCYASSCTSSGPEFYSFRIKFSIPKSH